MTIEEKPRDPLLEGAQPLEVFRHLQRRDWELWSIALLTLTVFAGGLLAYYYWGTAQERVLSPTAARYIWLVLFGLVALVILLNIYLIAHTRTVDVIFSLSAVVVDYQPSANAPGMLDPLT